LKRQPYKNQTSRFWLLVFRQRNDYKADSLSNFINKVVSLLKMAEQNEKFSSPGRKGKIPAPYDLSERTALVLRLSHRTLFSINLLADNH
jgi:hypothetical protein